MSLHQQISRQQLSLIKLEASHQLAAEYAKAGREVLRPEEWEPAEELEYRLRLKSKIRELLAHQINSLRLEGSLR